MPVFTICTAVYRATTSRGGHSTLANNLAARQPPLSGRYLSTAVQFLRCLCANRANQNLWMNCVIEARVDSNLNCLFDNPLMYKPLQPSITTDGFHLCLVECLT